MSTEIHEQIKKVANEDALEILNSFAQEENDYTTCKALEAALNTVGYSIEWGLDAEPFNLHKL